MFEDAEALSWIGNKLGVDQATLQKALEERYCYRRVFIPKRGPQDRAKRRKRVLHVPPGTMKEPGPLRQVQTRIHKWLRDSVKWPKEMHGFIPKCSHLTAAARHALPKTPALLTIDFKNAFDSVTFNQVYRAFMLRLGLDPRVAYWLAELTTHKKHLPQGAASSPLIFNLVAWDLDEELKRYAVGRGYTYTRYTDEVALTASKVLSEEERRNGARVISKEHRQEVVELCRKFGFRVPPEKVRYQERRWGTLETTNVLIREWGLGLSNRKVVARVRAMAHRAITDTSITPEKLRGAIGWVATVDPNKLKTRLRKPIRQLERLGVLEVA